MNKLKFRSMTISRGYTADSPFRAQIEVHNHSADIVLKLELNEERTLAIIDHVSDLIVEAMNLQMETFATTARQLVLEQQQKQAAIEHKPPYELDDDDVPF